MKRYNITVNGKAYDVAVEEVGGSAAAAPGTILDIKVAVGDTVKSGQAICVLEAMKMENDVNAPCDGKVLSVNTTKGSAVETGAVLAVIG